MNSLASPPVIILGLGLVLAGVGLYLLRSMRPELSRDHDIFFSAVGLVCGGIILFFGWTMDRAILIAYLLLAGSTVSFAYEAIRLRGIATKQAKRNTRVVDRERPVSRTRVYQEAELDGIEPYDRQPRYNNPRLRGYQEPPETENNSEYQRQEPSSSRSRSRYDRYSYEEPSRKNRRSSKASSYNDRYEEDWGENPDRWEETTSYSKPPRRRPPASNPSARRSRSSKKPRRTRAEMEATAPKNYRSAPGDYADYYPVNDSDNPDGDRY